MKTILVENLTKSKVEKNYLKNIKPSVIQVRNEFYRFLQNFPRPLDKIIKNHFDERLSRAGENLMLGEYAPFILGDLFNVSKSTINKIAFPWFLLYEYSLILDDLLDKERKYWKLELISSQKLLDKSYQMFFNDMNDHIDVILEFNKFRDQSFNSIIKEIFWSNNGVIDNKDSAILFQGRKAALVKFCISYMINIDKNRDLFDYEEKALDNICASIQLIDDLTDFIEDHNENRINIMLSTIYNWIKEKYSIDFKNISTNQLIAGLFFSNSLSSTLDISSSLLISNNHLIIKNKYNSDALTFFNDIANNCKNKSEELDILLRNMNQKDVLLNNLFNSKINNDKIDIETFIYWKKLLDFLKIAPKASN